MSVVKIHRTTALPQTLEANSIYIVAPPNTQDYAEVYITGNTASVVRRLLNKQDVENIVQTQPTNANAIKVVNNIAERDALNPSSALFVLVLDATSDPTVQSGSASYVYNPSTQSWVKVAEYESMDLVITWGNIQGKPSSSPADIDDAVAKRHTHANITQLNKIGEDTNGYLLYNNAYPKIAWDIVDW